jgi:hypothetical protein
MAEHRRIRLKRINSSGLAAAAILLLGAALYSGAWFADDALRLWRLSLNWLRFGDPDFNLGHRALEFCQPLWVVLLTCGFAAGGRLAATATALQFVLFCGGAWLLWSCHVICLRQGQLAGVAARNVAKVVFVGALLAMSNSFREYMASGLEYPLCFFLVALLALTLARRDAGDGAAAGAIMAATAAGSLLILTRFDLAWALAPAAVVVGWGSRRTLGRHWRAAALGLCPLVLWALFSEIHFGSIIAHPPDGEILRGLPRAEKLTHGTLYVLSGIIQEPLTLLLVSLGVAAGIRAYSISKRGVTPLVLGLGAVAYIGFIVWRGGDPSSGRMFCPVAILAAAALACAPAFPLRVYVFTACCVALFFDLGKVSLARAVIPGGSHGGAFS